MLDTKSYFCAGESARVEMPKFAATFTGTGDLFAALILAWGHEPLQVSLIVIHGVIIRVSSDHCQSECV